MALETASAADVFETDGEETLFQTREAGEATDSLPKKNAVDEMKDRLHAVYGELEGVHEYLEQAATFSAVTKLPPDEPEAAKAFERAFRQLFIRGENTLNLFRGGRSKAFRSLHREIGDPQQKVKSLLQRKSKVLGKGGFGTATEYPEMDTVVKKMNLNSNSDTAQQRFDREIEAAKYLMFTFPGIAPAFLGEGTTVKGERFFQMEKVHGETLKNVLERKQLRYEDTCALIAKLAEVVSEFHGSGMVHRDLKPANIMLTNIDADPLDISKVGVKIIDLGMVKFLDRSEEDETVDPNKTADQGITRTGDLLGTPEYMAPGQILDPAAKNPGNDFYSLGLIAYEMLTKKKPRHRMEKEGIVRYLNSITEQGDQLDFSSLPPEAADGIEGFLSAKDVDSIQIFKDLAQGKNKNLAGLRRTTLTALKKVKNFVRKPVVYVSTGLTALTAAIPVWLYLAKGNDGPSSYNGNGIQMEPQRLPHEIIVTPAEKAHPSQSRLTRVEYQDGSHLPVVLFPGNVQGEAPKFSKAADLFIGEVYVGSLGMYEEPDGQRKSQKACYYSDTSKPGDAVLFTGMYGVFHRNGEQTNAYYGMESQADIPIVSHCANKERFLKIPLDSPLKQLYRNIAGLKKEDIRVERRDESMLKGMRIGSNADIVRLFIGQADIYGKLEPSTDVTTNK